MLSFYLKKLGSSSNGTAGKSNKYKQIALKQSIAQLIKCIFSNMNLFSRY